MNNLRAAAASIMKDVLVRGRSLNDSLPAFYQPFNDPRDRALLQALTFGVCRWYFQLSDIANTMLKKPFKEKDQDIYALILLGLYQLTHMRIAEHAAIGETVAAADALKKPWAKGLINAVLREHQRHPKDAASEEGRLAHPAWFIGKIKKAYPADWQLILDANNIHPPLSLRVNQHRISRDNYLKKLQDASILAEKIAETDAGITLQTPMDVTQLPGFATGDVSVQDGAAQLAAELLQLESGQCILDACAAPGGKTAHILERQPDADVLALDIDADRLKRVEENLQRLQLKAICKTADAEALLTWWDKTLFDRILLDVPCSATGVIRRHPDIKLLRRPEDLATLAEKQIHLLNTLWETLKPGGLLLYATCSIFPDENTKVLQQFLETHPLAREEKIHSAWGKECAIGKQILPGMHGMDGFYFARLRK